MEIKDERDKTPEQRLVKAAKQGNLTLVGELIAAGIYINTNNIYGETPLIMSLIYKHNDITSMLIKAGADVNKADIYKNSPLKHAIKEGLEISIKLLIDNGAVI